MLRLIPPSLHNLKCVTSNLPVVSVYSHAPQFNLLCWSTNQNRHYAKANVGIPSLGKKPSKLKGAGPAIEKKKLPVETDANKLVNYVCGTCLTKTGEDIKLKEDSEYPEWLWTLNTTGKPPPLEEIDPDDDYYWIRVRKIAMRRSLQMMRLKKF